MTIKNKDMLALEHAWWLEEKFENVSRRIINLEKAMIQDSMGAIVTVKKDIKKLDIYKNIRKQNLHKMEPIPVCSMEKFR